MVYVLGIIHHKFEIINTAKMMHWEIKMSQIKYLEEKDNELPRNVLNSLAII